MDCSYHRKGKTVSRTKDWTMPQLRIDDDDDQPHLRLVPPPPPEPRPLGPHVIRPRWPSVLDTGPAEVRLRAELAAMARAHPEWSSARQYLPKLGSPYEVADADPDSITERNPPQACTSLRSVTFRRPRG